MQVLNLLNQTNNPIIHKYEIGEELGQGSDGQVFELSNNRVIKYCVIYESYNENPILNYEKINIVLNYIENKKPNICAKVYKHGFLGKHSESTYYWERDYVLYYYIMERLNKITQDENKVFHSLLSHEDRGIIKNYSSNQIEEMLSGLSLGLNFSKKEVIKFYNNIKISYVKHLDLHVRNIMKTNNGQFRLIDFDRTTLGE